MSPSRVLLAIVVSAGFLLPSGRLRQTSALSAQGAVTELRAVAELGDLAPGATDAATIRLIGDAPAVDADGNVALVALVAAGDSPTRQAVLRRLGDRLEVVFEEGDDAPGIVASFAAFPGLPFTPKIERGRLFITATVHEGPGTSPRAGLWSDRSGAFQPVVLQGDALPGMPAGAGLADWDIATRLGGDVILLRGRFAEGGSINPDSRGLWRNRSGVWEVLVVRALPVPGLSGARFGGSPSGPFGPIFSYGIDAIGRVATQSWIAGRRIDPDNDEGIWLETGSQLALLVREGARTGDKGKVTFGPSAVSPTFGGFDGNVQVVMNSTGVVAFGAILRTSRETFNSIWTTRGGAPQRLVLGGLPLVGGGTGDPAPGLRPGARFASFLGVALNDTGVVAFQGFADEFGDIFRLTDGIWWDAPGALTLALAAGHPAPTLPGVTVHAVRFEALAPDGSLMASAVLSGPGVTPSSDRALYRFSASGAPAVVLREGNEVDVISATGAVTTRTLAEFRMGTGAAGDGTYVLDARFADGSGGVYLLPR